jgi:hypothetical protein
VRRFNVHLFTFSQWWLLFGSGVNGLLVGDWIKAHADEVISHSTKYGMQNSKDPQRLDTYYNKRHGSEKITKILSLVNEQCLDGEAPVK